MYSGCTGGILTRYSQEIKTTQKTLLANLRKSGNFVIQSTENISQSINLAHSVQETLRLFDVKLQYSKKRELEDEKKKEKKTEKA